MTSVAILAGKNACCLRSSEIYARIRAWRHWGCTTKKIIENMKKSFESASELDGFDEVSEENQAKLTAAWEAGEVADEGRSNNAAVKTRK